MERKLEETSMVKSSLMFALSVTVIFGCLLIIGSMIGVAKAQESAVVNGKVETLNCCTYAEKSVPTDLASGKILRDSRSKYCLSAEEAIKGKTFLAQMIRLGKIKVVDQGECKNTDQAKKWIMSVDKRFKKLFQ